MERKNIFFIEFHLLFIHAHFHNKFMKPLVNFNGKWKNKQTKKTLQLEMLNNQLFWDAYKNVVDKSACYFW